MAKLEILTSSEQTAFDSPSHFSESEQENYFHLPSALQQWLKTVTHPTHEVGLFYCGVIAKQLHAFFNRFSFIKAISGLFANGMALPLKL